MAKKPGAGGVILVAVVLGSLTAYLIWAYLRNVESKNRKNWQPVVVALKDIPPRTKITRDMIELTQFPKEHMAENAVSDVTNVENRITVKFINAKDQIHTTDLVLEGQGPTLAYDIPEGMRAIAIGAGEIIAVGTSVKPGDRVDILATYQDPRTHQELTKMILQNVLVLAVNLGETDPAGKKGASSSMTLAVQPEQTELIAMADRAGALRVSLRPVHDSTIVASDGVTYRDIAGGKVPEEATGNTNQPTQTPVFINLPATTPSPRRGGMIIIRGVQEQPSSP
jgi:pilus assembly protein CpaB